MSASLSKAVKRCATEVDAEGVREIYAPVVRDTAISFEVEEPTRQVMAERIASTLERWPWLVCDNDGKVAGYAYASQHRARAAYRWSVDVTAYVHVGFRGRGVGSSLYRSLFRILALQGYYNAYAGITLPNAASVALHEALGFQPVGTYRAVGYKLGAWHDVGWWELSLCDRTHPSSDPVEFLAVRSRPEVAQALAAP